MKERWKTRRFKYLVGYMSAGNTMYSTRDGGRGGVERDTWYTDPMSWHQAERFLATMPCADAAIFELVPVKVNR
jgi:hypothetical protein